MGLGTSILPPLTGTTARRTHEHTITNRTGWAGHSFQGRPSSTWPPSPSYGKTLNSTGWKEPTKEKHSYFRGPVRHGSFDPRWQDHSGKTYKKLTHVPSLSSTEVRPSRKHHGTASIMKLSRRTNDRRDYSRDYLHVHPFYNFHELDYNVFGIRYSFGHGRGRLVVGLKHNIAIPEAKTQRGKKRSIPKVRASFPFSSQPFFCPLTMDRLIQCDGGQRLISAATWHDFSSRRIGEASHPGPGDEGQDSDHKLLRIRTINVTSAISNRTPIFDQRVNVMAIQEHCVMKQLLLDSRQRPSCKDGRSTWALPTRSIPRSLRE